MKIDDNKQTKGDGCWRNRLNLKVLATIYQNKNHMNNNE